MKALKNSCRLTGESSASTLKDIDEEQKMLQGFITTVGNA
jgi:hypothetical protein